MGPLIVFEGLDGCGKSLQARVLAEHLTDRGIPYVLTKQPTTGPVGRLIRDASRVDACDFGWTPSARVFAMLFAADRVDHYENVIWPALVDGHVVICDRYVHSSVCYQGGQLGAGGAREVRALNAHVPAPDLTILIDVALETARTRLKMRALAPEVHEAEDALAQAARMYAELERFCPGERIVRVSGEGTVADVHRRVLDVVAPLIRRA